MIYESHVSFVNRHVFHKLQESEVGNCNHSIGIHKTSKNVHSSHFHQSYQAVLLPSRWRNSKCLFRHISMFLLRTDPSTPSTTSHLKRSIRGKWLYLINVLQMHQMTFLFLIPNLLNKLHIHLFRVVKRQKILCSSRQSPIFHILKLFYETSSLYFTYVIKRVSHSSISFGGQIK